jgi:putative FmdB family regulatory protein
MPIYQYKAIKNGCKNCTPGFEFMQSMKDKPLQECPQCGEKVKKVPVQVSGYVPMLSNSNLRDKGFTKLVKRDKGTYEKVT